MSFADWFAGRKPHVDRLPAGIEELRGPARGVVSLPRHLALPGLREYDVTDDATRRSMYGIVLTQGQRNDVARFLNPDYLRQDWPLLAGGLEPTLRGACERRFALGRRARGGDEADAEATAVEDGAGGAEPAGAEPAGAEAAGAGPDAPE